MGILEEGAEGATAEVEGALAKALAARLGYPDAFRDFP